MTLRVFTTVVEQFPEVSDVRRARAFLRELLCHMANDRPYIVLDLSKAGVMDRSAIYLLLCCLEEAIKRNGDVRLAAIPLGTRAGLELTGVDRLFEIFGTNAEAVNSFRRLPADEASHAYVHGSSHRASEEAS